jgi:hypothetical protein
LIFSIIVFLFYNKNLILLLRDWLNSDNFDFYLVKKKIKDCDDENEAITDIEENEKQQKKKKKKTGK